MPWVTTDPVALIEQTTPAEVRSGTVLALLKALCANVLDYQERFLSEREARLRLCAYGMATVEMEAMLNDRFDPDGRGIRIVSTSVYKEVVPVYNPGFGPDATLFNPPRVQGQWVVYGSSARSSAQSFLVLVPQAVAADGQWDTGQAAALINRYKLAGKDYRIMAVNSVGVPIALIYTFIGYKETI